MEDLNKHHFKSEVTQLLQLMIHSLYSNKEIFLRELISNASDAADKLRFLALENVQLYENDGQLVVRLSIDKAARTITISDNGIGMNREEAVENLGTIAKSGTKIFLKTLEQDKGKTNQLIGQFGVGFYSAFIVADKVTVHTRKAGDNEANGAFWESTGDGTYSEGVMAKKTRGTDITLHLKKDEEEFLDEHRLRMIVKKYAEHITLPVELQVEKKLEVSTEELAEVKNAEKSENLAEKSSSQAIIYEWEKINSAQALWTRNKNEIEAEEYKEFYKHISHDFADPLIWSHNHVEGKQEYTSLLYIPSKAPWDLWNRDHRHGLKLYVQRVFIMDDAKQFMPNYLRFVRGLIDSNDLPLNVSREILQDNKITHSLRNALTKRALQLLENLAKTAHEAETSENPHPYTLFWNNFGLVLKEGPAEDFTNRETIAKLLRFASTHNEHADQTVSLQAYLERMQPDQDKIYYITADSFAAAQNSPHLEAFRKKGIEVLLLSDHIDEWMMGYLTDFASKSFQSISKHDEKLNQLLQTDEESEKQKTEAASLVPIIEKIKKVLGDKVKSVDVTYRLTETPAVVATEQNEMSTQMAKLLAAAGQTVPNIKYIFSINPNHQLIKYISTIIEEDKIFSEWVKLLFEQALLAEKATLENPHKMINRMNSLFIQQLTQTKNS